ncbi:MAG: hypothetical protein K2K45_07460 [Muribaculaceae bacterium]|nr:hypothetical protein [Muribaculaceae bacterium]MDE7096572.1 hypothetical protein [Muribaculaceae bacterium]
MRKSALIIVGSLSIAVGCGSGGNDTTVTDSDIVAQYRDSVLLLPDIIKQLPSGISEADSAALIKKITDRWIEGLLIEDLAAGQIDDMDRIDALTDMYRRSLIADSYRRKMRQNGVQPVDMNKVRNYYKTHLDELKLERPIVKGLYIRLPSSSRHLDDIRIWMKNADPSSYDELENTGRREATGFSYFADRWIDFDIIAGEIPYKFGDADKFIEETKDFETELNGTIYILHLTDYRKTGETIPEEYAVPLIEDRMSAQNLAEYEAGLIKALRKSAIENNILKEGTYFREQR